jgi:hypothetical protein
MWPVKADGPKSETQRGKEDYMRYFAVFYIATMTNNRGSSQGAQFFHYASENLRSYREMEDAARAIAKQGIRDDVKIMITGVYEFKSEEERLKFAKE